MILNGIGTRRFIVNLFSEFLLKQFPTDSKTIIEIADCENFFIVKGVTNYNDVIDISKVKEEFASKYSDYLGENIFHTIDLIEYDKEIDDTKMLFVDLYNSINPIYSTNQIQMFNQNNKGCYDLGSEIIDDMIIKNTFPHSISIGKGRLLYYYAKHIAYNIPPTYPFDKIEMRISVDNVEIYSNGKRDLDLESAILDVFDFDMKWLEKEIKKVDLCEEIINPLEDFEFLKKKVKDFIII